MWTPQRSPSLLATCWVFSSSSSQQCLAFSSMPQACLYSNSSVNCLSAFVLQSAPQRQKGHFKMCALELYSPVPHRDTWWILMIFMVRIPNFLLAHLSGLPHCTLSLWCCVWSTSSWAPQNFHTWFMACCGLLWMNIFFVPFLHPSELLYPFQMTPQILLSWSSLYLPQAPL